MTEGQQNPQNSDSNDDQNSSFINNTPIVGGNNRHPRALRTAFTSRWNLPPPPLLVNRSTSTLSSTTSSYNGNGVSSDYLTHLHYVEEQGLPTLRIESPTLGQRQITHDQVHLNPNMARNRIIAQPSLPIDSTVNGSINVNNFAYDYGSEYVQEQRHVRMVADNLPILRTHQSVWEFYDQRFELMDVQQMDMILQSMVLRDQTSFIRSCNHYIRKEKVKALIRNLKTQDQKFIFAWVIGKHIISLAKSPYGQEVVLFLLSLSDNHIILKFLFGEMAKHCPKIASDPMGCRLFQKCISPFIGVNVVNQLILSIIINSLYLSENHYGNYVVQHVINFQIDCITRGIVRELEGNFVDLSMNKYGSNVVETCLTVCREKKVYSRIISELSNPNYFLRLLQHPFGNFVIQSALEASMNMDEEIYRELVRRIMVHSSSLRGHLYGERVWHKICGR